MTAFFFSYIYSTSSTTAILLLQPYFPIPLLHTSPPISFIPLSSALSSVSGSQVVVVVLGSLPIQQCPLDKLFSTWARSLSVCLSITVSLSLNVPNAQLHSHYLLITLDTTATGSTVTKRAECKSVTFVLTLFVGLLFSTGWWHVKCSPGDCGNLEQYGNRGADGYFSSHQTLFLSFHELLSAKLHWRFNWVF